MNSLLSVVSIAAEPFFEIPFDGTHYELSKRSYRRQTFRYRIREALLITQTLCAREEPHMTL